MSLLINWVEVEPNDISVFSVPYSVANLKVYLADQVIVKTEWSFDDLVTVGNNALVKQVEDYLQTPCRPIQFSLLLQGSVFRRKVWSELCRIHVGQVMTYRDLADKINSAPRAVANACRDNQFPGIIPCHRVVSVSGLGGYMGEINGPCLEIKRKLLLAEGVEL